MLLVAMVACQSDPPGLTTLYPVLEVDPAALDFGDVGVPSEATATVTVRNAGRADLEVTPSLNAPGVFSLDLTGTLVVEPESEVALAVTFAPETYQDYTGRLLLESNDPDAPQGSLPMMGRGVDMALPDIEIEPQTVEEHPAVGESVLMSFTVRNVGEGDLQLHTFVLDGPPEFVALSWPSDSILPAGQETQAVVEYTPTSPLGHCANVIVPSNDPDESTLGVLLLGNDGQDCDRPVAQIECPSIVQLAGPEWVHLSGEDSLDPAGAPLRYQWTVTGRPSASGGQEIDPYDTPEVEVYVDVAGDWEVQLVVTNTLGISSAPAVCAFVAQPEDALHVELSWDSPLADIDLHVSQYGYSLFDVPQDCSFCNDLPDWGARLDLDDQGGYGPENINLFVPTDDYYQVRVHYWAANGEGAVQATVQIWLHGLLVHDETRVMEYDEVWDVGTADMLQEAVINGWPVTDPLPQATTHGCPP
jgi:hypothetical protein